MVYFATIQYAGVTIPEFSKPHNSNTLAHCFVFVLPGLCVSVPYPHPENQCVVQNFWNIARKAYASVIRNNASGGRCKLGE